MDSNIAIKVSRVSKTFRIPHEKVSSLRGAAVSVFSRNKGFEEFKVYPIATLYATLKILTLFLNFDTIKLLKSPVLTT